MATKKAKCRFSRRNGNIPFKWQISRGEEREPFSLRKVRRHEKCPKRTWCMTFNPAFILRTRRLKWADALTSAWHLLWGRKKIGAWCVDFSSWAKKCGRSYLNNGTQRLSANNCRVSFLRNRRSSEKDPLIPGSGEGLSQKDFSFFVGKVTRKNASLSASSTIGEAQLTLDKGGCATIINYPILCLTKRRRMQN